MAQAGLRGLAEGALVAALCVVLGLSAHYLPVLGVAAVFVGPVPIVVACLRHGPRIAAMAAVVAAVLLGTFLGALQGLVLGFAFGTMGLALGIAFARRMSPSAAILWASLATASATALSMGVAFLFLNVSPTRMVEEMFQAYEGAAELWGRLGVPALQEQAQAMLAMARQSFALAWPAAFAAALVLLAVINWAVARGILRRLGHRVPGFPPFVQWRFPRWLAAPFLLGWAAWALLPYHRLDWLFRVGVNVTMVLSLAMYLQGAAVALSFLRRWVGARAGLVLAVLLLLRVDLVLMLLLWVGVFDLLFDYRRLAGPLPERGDSGEGDPAGRRSGAG